MNQQRHITTVCGTLACLIAVSSGCAPSKAPAEWRAKTVFGASVDGPRIVVYGNLARFVPQFNPTPKLDEFLYGPAEPPGLLLRNPQGVAMLNTTLLVCDQGYPDIVSIDLATGRSTNWTDADHRPRCPVAIAVSADQQVYVGDTNTRAVLVYHATGAFIEQLSPTLEPERTFRPCSLAINGGVLYVGNVGDRRVERWHLGRREWLTPMMPPAGARPLIAPTGLAITKNGTLLIVDSVQACIFRVTADGQWLEPIGSPGRMEGQFVRPKQIACTPSGLIFVTDAGRQSVVVFSADGEFVSELHEREKEWSGFTLPAGVLALPGDGLNALMSEGRALPEPRPAEWVIVSDTLQAASLNVLGVMLPQGGEATHAAR